MGSSINDQPRITNNQFLKLVKAGLLGSTPAQSKIIDKYLVGKAKDQRLKLVFTETKENVDKLDKQGNEGNGGKDKLLNL